MEQYTTHLNENGEFDVVPIQQQPALDVPTQQKPDFDPNPAFYIQRLSKDTRSENVQNILANGKYTEQLWVSYMKPNGFILSEPATKEHTERWPDAYNVFLAKCQEQQQQKIQAEQFELRRRGIAENEKRKLGEIKSKHAVEQELRCKALAEFTAEKKINTSVPTFDDFPNFDPQEHFINSRAR